MKQPRIFGSIALAIMVSGALALPGLALAQEEATAKAPEVEEDNPATQLAVQPAVRHRLLLVKGRFELTPAFESTINADYKHTLGLGAKVEYHLSDMFSVGALGFYGLSFNTGLVSDILGTLPETRVGVGVVPDDDALEVAIDDPTPTKDEFSQHLNSIPLHGALYVSVTPWYGKLAAFGRAFLNFDFYFQAGLAFAQLDSSCDATICDDTEPGVPDTFMDDEGNLIIINEIPHDDPPLNDGTRLGLYLGAGIHVFLNNWIALDLTVRNYAFSDNPSGVDFDVIDGVTDDDSRFLNHIFMGIGVSMFFPTRAERTD